MKTISKSFIYKTVLILIAFLIGMLIANSTIATYIGGLINSPPGPFFLVVELIYLAIILLCLGITLIIFEIVKETVVSKLTYFSRKNKFHKQVSFTEKRWKNKNYNA